MTTMTENKKNPAALPSDTLPLEEQDVIWAPGASKGEEDHPAFNPVDTKFLRGLENLKNVGRYEIVKKLGQGGSGLVYLGWDPYIKRHVSIKISRPTSEKFRELFFLEAQSAGRLNHPNIVGLYDFGVCRDYCYLAMEYIDGDTLEKYCRPDNLPPLGKVVEIIGAVCQALDYAHQAGVIHRDIKPSNILVDKNGVIKVTDFGIAQISGATGFGPSRLDGGSTLIRRQDIYLQGTPSYMSPDQLKNEMVGHESDIFSLGCVLYELLTGRQAFSGDSIFSIAYKINHEDPPPLSTFVPELPAKLEEITKKAMAKNPGDRYRSCVDLAWDMREILRNLTEPSKEAGDFFDFIQNTPFFHSFTKDQVRELVAVSNIIRVKKGNIIINEGDTDDTFYIILSGRVKVKKGPRILALIESGNASEKWPLSAINPAPPPSRPTPIAV